MTSIPFRAEKRWTVIVPSGGVQHLFLIVTNPCPASRCLLVNFSSIKEGHPFDDTCIVEPGVHGRITKPSFVYYAGAVDKRVETILKFIDQWYYHPETEWTDDGSFGRICAGILASDRTPRRLQKYFADNRHR